MENALRAVELTEYGLVPEEYGGDTMFVNISALKGTGVEDLLDSILLVAAITDMKATRLPPGANTGVYMTTLLRCCPSVPAFSTITSSAFHRSPIALARRAIASVCVRSSGAIVAEPPASKMACSNDPPLSSRTIACALRSEPPSRAAMNAGRWVSTTDWPLIMTFTIGGVVDSGWEDQVEATGLDPAELLRTLDEPPEVLRTNLASVILQMEVLGLGRPADFPFIDPPDTRQINEGLSFYMRRKRADDYLAVKTELAALAGVSPEEIAITRNTTGAPVLRISAKLPMSATRLL